MCGIAGIAGREDAALLRAMTDALAHRGPDDQGAHLADGVSLGHRRLSIIDLAAGRQPMSTRDGALTIVFNGEIYNFRELRRDLEAAGRVFDTRSDTEVILAAWAEWGEKALERLEGMFAFALWDRTARRLYLARDAVGIKPLYYAHTGSALCFASEMKSLFLCPGVDLEMDPESLDDYLTWLHTVPPRTFYRGIRQLPPAHLAVWSAETGMVSLRRYWRLADHLDTPPKSPGEWEEELRARLREVVDRHLVADVPVGALLSGGVDSAALVALMRGGGVRPATFTVGYENPSLPADETAEARATAAFLGSDHHELRLGPAEGDFLDTLLRHFDEPYGNPMALLTHAVCGLVRRHVTVVLSGDGGDECFGGYPRYRGMVLAQKLAGVPAAFWRAARPLAALIPEDAARGPWPRRVRGFLSADPRDPMAAYARWLSRFTPEMKDALYTGDLKKTLAGRDAWDTVRGFARESGRGDPLSQAMYVDAHLFLPHNVLHCGDRMSMAHGLEMRVPFADRSLLAFMTAAPPELKVLGRETKVLLRRALAPELPPAVLRRPKRGFEPPRGAWLTGRLQTERDRLFSDAALARDGLFNPAAVRRMLDEHAAGRRDHTLALWALLVFQHWRNTESGGA